MPDSTNNQRLLYTNTGEYYYTQAKEGENHTLSVTETDDAVTITCDGVAAHTITKGLDGWSIPLFACKDVHDRTYLYSIYYYVEFNRDANEIDKRTEIVAPCLDFDGTSYSTMPATYNINGKSISDTQSNVSQNLMFYLTNTGDYVLSESPVVAEEQMIYTSDMFQTYDPSSDPKTIKYVSIAGSGTIETIGTGKTSGDSGNGVFIPSAFYDWETYNSTTGQYIGWFDCQSSYGWEEGDVVTHTTSTPNGTKLDDISLTIRWENTDSTTENVELTKFIVPVEIKTPSPAPTPTTPTLKTDNVSMAGWFKVKIVRLEDFNYESGGFKTPYRSRAVLTVNGESGLIGYVDYANQKILLYSNGSEISGTVTADIYLLLE